MRTYRFFFFSGVLSYNHQGLPDALMNQPLPRILSRGETFRAAIGERIILPCQVKDLGKYNYKHIVLTILRWKKFNGTPFFRLQRANMVCDKYHKCTKMYQQNDVGVTFMAFKGLLKLTFLFEPKNYVLLNSINPDVRYSNIVSSKVAILL